MSSTADPTGRRRKVDDRVEAWVRAHERALVGGVLLVALALRIFHLLQIREHDPFFDLPSVDPKVYHEWAQRIAGGAWLGDEVFFLSPLYPYFLALIYKLAGPSLLVAKLIQLLLGTVSCLLVYLVGKRVFDARTGLVAAALSALYVMSIFYEGVLLVTALQAPLNLLLVLLLLRAAERDRPRDWLAAGALLGLSALARPNVLLLGAWVVLWALLAWRGGATLRRLAPRIGGFGLGVALLVLPVTARNLAVGDDLVLISSQGGANFYIGNGPDATGVFNVPRVFPPTRADDPLQQQAAYRRVAEIDSGRELAPSEVSAFWYDRALDEIAARPTRWLGLLATKLGLFVNAFEFGNSRDFYSSRDFSAVLRLPLPGFAVVGPLALLGMVVVARRFRAAFWLYGMIATYAVSLVVYFVLAHYRMPVIPFFALFAAAGVVWLLDRLRALRAGRPRQGAPLLGAIVVLVAAVGVTQLELGPAAALRGSFMIHYNLANRYRQLGRRAQAIAAYEKSIELNPDYISAHHNLGLLSEEEPADLARAERAWRAVLELARRHRDREYFERAQRHLERIRQLEEHR